MMYGVTESLKSDVFVMLFEFKIITAFSSRPKTLGTTFSQAKFR